MSGNKRKLGLGRASQAKKHRAANDDEQVLTVELKTQKEGEMGELEGLWETWIDGDQDNELVLNGIINECDRLERNAPGGEVANLGDEYYAIYAMALSEMAKFQADDVEGWIEFSWDKINKVDPKSDVGSLAQCVIGLNEIGVVVGKLEVDSTDCKHDIVGLFNKVMANWEKAKDNVELLQNRWVVSILDTFDDLLDVIDKFGQQKTEVVDSDNEDAIEVLDEHLADVELKETHPLYKVQQTDDFNEFWRSAMLDLKDKVTRPDLKRPILKKLGQSYLMEAEHPIFVFTSLTYEKDAMTQDEKTQAEEAQKDAKALVAQALELLEQTWDEEDPQSWVDIAEAEITMGNLFEVDSSEQEEWYGKAEKKLKMANNSTHGKYQQILDSLKPDQE